MTTTFESDEAMRFAAYTALEQAVLDGNVADVRKARARLRSLKLLFLRDMRLQATEGALARAGVQPSAWAARHMCKGLFGQAAAMAELVLRFAEHRGTDEPKRSAAERSDMSLIEAFVQSDVAEALRTELAIETTKYVVHGQLLRARARASLGLSSSFKGGIRPLDD